MLEKTALPIRVLKVVALGLACLLYAAGSQADDSDLQQWTTFNVALPSISEKWSFGIWNQARWDQDISHFNWLLINPSAHYKLNHGWKVGFGYQYIIKNGASDESMPWQEFAHSHKFSNGLVIGNRMRLEQRLIEDVSGVVFRFRYRLSASYPIGSSGMYLTGSEAYWTNLNEKDGGPDQGFDQNRLFGGLGWHVGNHWRIEAGYQWRHKSNGENDHVIMLQIFLNTKGKTVTHPIADEAHH